MGNDSYNNTGDLSGNATVASPLSPVTIVCLAIYCVVFVTGMLGNALVIYVTGRRMKKTVNTVWFLNLALADFIFTAFLIFTIVSVSQGFQWPFGDMMCKLNSLVLASNMFASVFLLMAISLDRCLATWVVVWAQNKRTSGKVEVMCVCVWLAALACSLPYAVIREVKPYNGALYCAFSDSFSRNKLRTLIIWRFVAGFAIPFLVIIGSYVAISVRARRLQRGKKKRSLRIVISIILAFFVCWMPYHVFQFLQFTPAYLWEPGIALSTALAFLNSCLNPVLYVFMCDEFQKKLKQSVCHVLESALADDALSFTSSRSLASHLSRISRKSDAGLPRKNTATSLTTSTDTKDVFVEEQKELYDEQDH